MGTGNELSDEKKIKLTQERVKLKDELVNTQMEYVQHLDNFPLKELTKVMNKEYGKINTKEEIDAGMQSKKTFKSLFVKEEKPKTIKELGFADKGQVEGLLKDFEKIRNQQKNISEAINDLDFDKIQKEQAKLVAIYSEYSAKYETIGTKIPPSVREAMDKVVRNSTGGQFSLGDTLIRPVQRPMRVGMLATAIVKATPEDHSDFKKYSNAAFEIGKAVKAINKNVGELNSDRPDVRSAAGYRLIAEQKQINSQKPPDLEITHALARATATKALEKVKGAQMENKNPEPPKPEKRKPK